MKKFSKKLSSMVTELIVSEIGSKALDGVTYVVIPEKERQGYVEKMCYDIAEERTKCGYGEDEVIRLTMVGNGLVADLDIGTVKAVTVALAKQSAEIDASNPIEVDLIRDMPEKHKVKEMRTLLKYIQTQMDAGHSTIDIALYNLNVGRTISVMGTQNGQKAYKKYNAYALRVEDMEEMNKSYLKKVGLKISSVSMGSIFPNKRGVNCKLSIEKR